MQIHSLQRPAIRLAAATAILSVLCISPAQAKGRFVLPPCPLVKSEEEPKRNLPAVQLNNIETESQKSKTPSTLDQAQKANLMPLAINQSGSETDKKRKLQFDSANQQLAELWQATIEKSEDIKMAVSLMQPNSDKKHTAAEAARMLSGLLFSAGSMMAPSLGVGTRIPAQLMLGTADGMVNRMIGKPKEEKGPITAEQSTLIYLLVRNYANKLQDDFQKYRLAITEYECASKTVNDTKQVLEVSPSLANDPLTVMRWTQSQEQEELAQNKVLIFRQRLIALAGEDAVLNLDKGIEAERLALIELIGAPEDQIPLVPGKAAKVNEKIESPTQN